MVKSKKQNVSDGVIRINTYSKWFNVALIALCFIVLFAVRIQTNQNTTGDEPYYLLMDYSMEHDNDLALQNNYEHKDFMGFYENTVLDPQGFNPLIQHKYAVKQYSVHGTGLPLFLLPGFVLAAKAGAVFEMIALATLVVWLTWIWTKQVTGSRMAAYVAAGLLAICYFFNGLVGAIYPDMLIAAITLVVLIMLGRYYKTPTHQILLGLVLGFLVLVHFKALSLTLPVLAILSYKLWKEQRTLPWRTVTIVAAFVSYYFLTLHQWFGLWNLSSIEGGQSFGANPMHNIPAMLFDSNRGLLVYNPILVLIFTGLPLWFSRHRRSLVVTLLSLLPTIAILCIIPNWNGSAAPVGRYIMEFLPAFIPAIAFVLLAARKVWQRVLIGLLATMTFLISLDAAMMRFPYINGGLFETKPILFTQIKDHTGLALSKVIPSYSNETTILGEHALLKLGACFLVVLLFFVYGCYLAFAKRNQLRST